MENKEAVKFANNWIRNGTQYRNVVDEEDNYGVFDNHVVDKWDVLFIVSNIVMLLMRKLNHVILNMGVLSLLC